MTIATRSEMPALIMLRIAERRKSCGTLFVNSASLHAFSQAQWGEKSTGRDDHSGRTAGSVSRC